jgi:hypothetical protein
VLAVTRVVTSLASRARTRAYPSVGIGAPLRARYPGEWRVLTVPLSLGRIAVSRAALTGRGPPFVWAVPWLLGTGGTSEYGSYVKRRPTRRRGPSLAHVGYRLCGLCSSGVPPAGAAPAWPTSDTVCAGYALVARRERGVRRVSASKASRTPGGAASRPPRGRPRRRGFRNARRSGGGLR